MTFLNQTEDIAACIGFLLMWAAHLWYSLSYVRLLQRQKEQLANANAEQEAGVGTSSPGISVIVPVYNAEQLLIRQLPLLLNQDYATFEVIVIDQNSTDGTLALLERLEKQYEHLRHTFVPDSARYISKHNLALTLGFKSARYDWVLMTTADCIPDGTGWLTSVSRFLQPDKDLVFGYVNFAPDKAPKKELFLQFYQQMRAFAWCSDHPAYRVGTCNLAYRKSCFLKQNGFASFSHLKYGAEEILANHHSNLANTSVCLLPQGSLVREYPGKKVCRQERVCGMETARYLKRRIRFRLQLSVILLIPWLFYAALLLGLFRSIWDQDWIMTGFYVLMTVVLWIIKEKRYHQASRAFRAGSCHVLLHVFELALPVWFFNVGLKHHFTAKKQFYKQYL